MKLIINKGNKSVSLKDGRTTIWKIEVPAGMTLAAIEGTLAAMDTETVTAEYLAEALARNAAKKGSVIPDDYRNQYGVDQNCGDDIAVRLREKTCDSKGKADMEAVRLVAEANGLADKFDVWQSRGLNNGMVRMNLGNVLRGKARAGEAVTI